MEVNFPFVFQADSELVNHHYNSDPNYIISFDATIKKEYCVIYFSSNDIYYPNNELAFSESIIKRNKFEWFNNRVKYGHKHIFLRDIKKQWYLTGINGNIDTPLKLFQFLQEETKGYKIVVIGSSAGGFNSIIIGQSLGAELIYSFNGQFEINSQLNKSKEDVDPIIFRNRFNSQLLSYYDTLNFIKNPDSIFYFHSNKSCWDLEQYEYAKNMILHKISFNTSNHGVPILRSNLSYVINLPKPELVKLSGKTYHPVLFSLQTVGFKDTIKGIKSIIKFGLNKIYIKTFQKWKINKKIA